MPDSFLKDPDERLPYQVDWSPWLTREGDTAASVDWITPTGITQETDPAPTLTDGKATAWLSGGLADQNYRVTCRLTTTGGRIRDHTITIMVRNR